MKNILFFLIMLTSFNVRAKSYDSAFYGLKRNVIEQILSKNNTIGISKNADSLVIVDFIDMKRYSYILGTRYSDKPFVVFRDEVYNFYKDSNCIRSNYINNHYRCDLSSLENYLFSISETVCDVKSKHSCFRVVGEPVSGWLKLEYVYFKRSEYSDSEKAKLSEIVEFEIPFYIYMDKSLKRFDLVKVTVKFGNLITVETEKMSYPIWNQK